jgi:hypothetical protein
MHIPVLSSTVLLTLLLSVGLFFFIRASTKDRIQVVKLVTEQPEESLLEQLQTYFTQRAYRIAAVDAAENRVTFEGFVRPSVFLAVFLTMLAAIGFLCLALVLALLFPDWAKLLPGIAVLSPIAGIFYWRKSARPEQVSLRIAKERESLQVLTVTAHRDELAELQRNLNLKPLEDA